MFKLTFLLLLVGSLSLLSGALAKEKLTNDTLTDYNMTPVIPGSLFTEAADLLNIDDEDDRSVKEKNQAEKRKTVNDPFDDAVSNDIVVSGDAFASPIPADTPAMIAGPAGENNNSVADASDLERGLIGPGPKDDPEDLQRKRGTTDATENLAFPMFFLWLKVLFISSCLFLICQCICDYIPLPDSGSSTVPRSYRRGLTEGSAKNDLEAAHIVTLSPTSG